ncbi:MAG: S-methyl-5-thioribose-1-phosphate isomerase, partial [Firmicutes bacterium]|nr:S-methyl-5-thioribose-1-phosphate isomerase [Bacillota bacterium]
GRSSRPGPPRPLFWDGLEKAHQLLRSTRPTAVNLFWALDRMMARAQVQREGGASAREVATALREEAGRMADDDVDVNRRIGQFGQTLLRDGDGVLTHCNAGALATVDYGTALGVIRAAHAAGKRLRVYMDETRPVLQGARLTAWEAVQSGWDATLITDNMAGHFMRLGHIQAAVVGADRVAANGDVANKIGTYSVAVLCHEHGIPFYVAAPISTLDLKLTTGEQIVIEERNPAEVTGYRGVRWAPEGVHAANPAFDVTPWRYVTAIITERGIAHPPFDVHLKQLADVADVADAV